MSAAGPRAARTATGTPAETPTGTRAAAGAESRVPKSAWLLLALLTGLNVLNFVARQLIPSLAPLLIADLGLTRAQVGSLVGFAFVVVYSVVGLALGLVADRWSRRRLVAGGLTVWSAMAAASGAARGFAGLAVPRVFSGLGQAALTPAALAMLGDVFPVRRLGLAAGIYYAGLPVGTGLSLGLASWLAPRYGWRACFYLVGAAGLAALGLVALTREPARAAAASSTAVLPASAARPAWRELMADVRQAIVERPALLLVMVGGATLTYASAAATHGVTWLVQERGFSFASAALQSGVMAVVSGFLGNIAGGWVSDWSARRWPGGRPYSLVILTACFAPFSVAFYALPPGSALFYACWFVTAASTVAYFGPLFSAVQELSPPRVRGSLVAFALLVVNLLGVGPGSLVTGYIGDRVGLSAGLVVAVGVTLVGIVPFVMAARARDAARP
jgi:MFS transporter, Spinster family, sphingosine-1-phosphate transporter